MHSSKNVSAIADDDMNLIFFVINDAENPNSKPMAVDITKRAANYHKTTKGVVKKEN